MATIGGASPIGTAQRYSRGAVAFHWVIAALILTNLLLGWRMSNIAGPNRFALFQVHKSIGITVLALSVLRLCWRLAHRPPALPTGMPEWERLAAHGLHWLFYALMLILPLTGWIIVSASPLNLPTLLFKTIPLPHIALVHDQSMVARKAIAENFGTAHAILAYSFLALIVLHIAAALKHHFIQRDAVLTSMLLRRPR